MSRAENLLIRFEPDKAGVELTKALAMQPNNSAVMDLMAQAHMELGQPDKALEMLEKSAQIDPQSSPQKWLYLGQLHGGEKAIECFQNGVDIMVHVLISIVSH